MTKTLTLGTLVLAFLVSTAPQFAAAQVGLDAVMTGTIVFVPGDDEVSKRSKPRVPGGSGCDDPRDLIEHPECRG